LGRSERPAFAGENLSNFLADLQANNAASVAASRENPLLSSFREITRNPRGVKENVTAETLARTNELYSNQGGSGPGFSAFENTASSVLEDAKREGFNPLGSWRSATTRDLQEGGTAQQDAAYYYENKARFGDKAVNKLQEFTDKLKVNPRDLVPGFIANPLALNNPLVKAGDVFQQGFKPDPKLAAWLATQSKSSKVFDKPLDALGGNVSVSSFRPTRSSVSQLFDISFRGPEGYKSPGEIRNDLAATKKALENLSSWENSTRESQERIKFLEDQVTRLNNAQSRFSENPYTSDAVKFQLGRAIEQIPVGSTITASPIGGAGGARSNLYARLSKGALAGKPRLQPNLEQVPSEEEFRAASEGRGYSPAELYNRNVNIAGNIDTNKAGPTSFVNAAGKPVEWNPSELKDPAIRRAFGIPQGVDVSSLRSDPMSAFLNKGTIDFSRPIITTDSPIYRVRQGLKGGASVGLSDLIPSPEAIRSFYAGDVKGGATRMAGDVISGVPTALAAAGTVAAAPALAPVAAGVGLGMTGVAAGRAVNEVVRQQTGEGIVDKFRQTIGTQPRTGIASPDRRTTPQTTTPTIRPMTPAQIKESERQRNRNELQRRIELAQERFNPAKGEFGFTELLFGR
jgi:hypothetical protein